MVSKLRKKHKRIIYESYNAQVENHFLRIQFRFILEPNISFYPSLTIPYPGSIDQESIKPFIFNLGMIELISYWKCACSPEIFIKAGSLSQDQTEFWRDLYMYGLGEFYYQNEIDFTTPDFLQIISASNSFYSRSKLPGSLSGNLILNGGGKDSVVTVETLRQSNVPFTTLLLNSTNAAREVSTLAGDTSPLHVHRSIDPTLLTLNKQGYLNGHTPFSAYLAFLGILCAYLYRNKYVIASNERSADESNIEYQNLTINHQYSKSLRFEKLFRGYSHKFLVENIEYFSFLRPLYDLTISKLFSDFPKYHKIFRSCNVNQKQGSWCGSCGKCAFVYLSLFPFLTYEQTLGIFKTDYFNRPEIATFIARLVGLTGSKPFECVGTKKESLLALCLSIRKYQQLKLPPPNLLSDIINGLRIDSNQTITQLSQDILQSWNSDHCLPPVFVQLLRHQLAV